jgi:hypothetical protein
MTDNQAAQLREERRRAANLKKRRGFSYLRRALSRGYKLMLDDKELGIVRDEKGNPRQLMPKDSMALDRSDRGKIKVVPPVVTLLAYKEVLNA